MEAVLKFGSWFEIELNGVYKFFRIGRFALGIARNNKPYVHIDAWKDGSAAYVHALGREILLSTNG